MSPNRITLETITLEQFNLILSVSAEKCRTVRDTDVDYWFEYIPFTDSAHSLDYVLRLAKDVGSNESTNKSGTSLSLYYVYGDDIKLNTRRVLWDSGVISWDLWVDSVQKDIGVRSRVMDFMRKKDELIYQGTDHALVDEHLLNEDDFEEMRVLFSAADCRKFIRNLARSAKGNDACDGALCIWCTAQHPVCGDCGYGKRHILCDRPDSHYRAIRRAGCGSRKGFCRFCNYPGMAELIRELVETPGILVENWKPEHVDCGAPMTMHQIGTGAQITRGKA